MTTQSPRHINLFLSLTATITATAGFLFGYDTGIISGALMFILQTFPVSVFTQELIVSAVVMGALIGAVSTGRLVEKFGCQRMLFVMSLTFIAGTFASSAAPNVTVLIGARFIVGVAIGMTSYVAPLFIAEMAPAEQRGKLVLLNGIMITSGEALAFLVDYLLVPTQSWRLMFATGLLPAIVLCVGLLLLPASPRWMAFKGQFEEGKAILAMIRPADRVEAEWQEILRHTQHATSRWSDLFSTALRPVMLIGLGLGVFQQFIGINTVMYYGPTIFKAAGFHSESAQILATFTMGAVNTFVTIIAVLIVDKVGRRRMLLGGLMAAGLSLFAIGMISQNEHFNSHSAWLTFFFMIIYIAGYSISLGSLFWLIISEIYPLNIRSLAMSVVTAAQWAASFVVALTFLSTLNAVGTSFTFWGYAAMCLISFLFCYYLVPETRGISLEHIEHNLRRGTRSRDLGQSILINEERLAHETH